MNTAKNAASPSFVVLQLGRRRFALPSESVVELAPPVRLHRFPHTSPLLAGVIVRRGHIVPVYDAASLLIGHSLSAQRFYLIARLRSSRGGDFGAIPLNGECELASGESLAPSADRPAWVSGTLSLNHESVDVIDFSALAESSHTTAGSPRSSGVPS